jgi:ATP-dependent Lon protease
MLPMFNYEETFFEENDLHIHVPAGAVPKDGPSAGLTIALSIASLLTGRPAKRTIASTGELTLSGRILPVGGIKEKLLAAKRAGVKTILIPLKNKADLNSIDLEITNDLEIKMFDELEQILADNLI